MELLKGTPYEGSKNWPKITLTQREGATARRRPVRRLSR
jgi:hypothetical protein